MKDSAGPKKRQSCKKGSYDQTYWSTIYTKQNIHYFKVQQFRRFGINLKIVFSLNIWLYIYIIYDSSGMMKNISLLKRLCDVLLAPPIYCSSNLLYPYTNICTVYNQKCSKILHWTVIFECKKEYEFFGTAEKCLWKKRFRTFRTWFF